MQKDKRTPPSYPIYSSLRILTGSLLCISESVQLATKVFPASVCHRPRLLELQFDAQDNVGCR